MQAEDSLRRVQEMSIALGKGTKPMRERVIGEWQKLAAGRDGFARVRTAADLDAAAADLDIEVVKVAS